MTESINRDSPVALITGSAHRLGRQIAYALAEKGFNIAINYNESRSGAREAVKHIHGLGRDAVALRADVTQRKQVQAMVKYAIKHFKKIDVLINNAAIFVDSPLEKTTDAIWDKTLALNLKGSFLCSEIVSTFMLKRKAGRIINVASLGGMQAWSNHIPYSVSKAGVIMLTKCLARSLAPDILVNAVAPGTIIIPGEEDSSPRHDNPEKFTLRRYGNPSDITELVLFLATTATYITGQTILVDGGRYI